MSDTKKIWLSLTDAWQLEEVLKGCFPVRLGEDGSPLLRGLQDVILALTFPDGVRSTGEITAYVAPVHPNTPTVRKELALTSEEAWLIVKNLGRTAYDGAQQVLLQVFFVLQQFDPHWEPEPDNHEYPTRTDLPPFMRGFKLEEDS